MANCTDAKLRSWVQRTIIPDGDSRAVNHIAQFQISGAVPNLALTAGTYSDSSKADISQVILCPIWHDKL